MKLSTLFSAVSAAKLSFEMHQPENQLQAANRDPLEIGWPTIESCQDNMYPGARVARKPEVSFLLKFWPKSVFQSFTINLDLPPNQRFLELGKKMGPLMKVGKLILRKKDST